MVILLTPERTAELREAPFTYPEVGATRGDLPAGYRVVRHRQPVPAVGFAAAAERLLTWRVHERAGLAVAATSARVHDGAVVELRLGPRPVGLRIPCRIVYVVDEPDRVGFAYGTLPGHPESGEELFCIERTPDGGAQVAITAFSRPATLPARLGGPLARRFQDLMTRRYARAAARR